MIFQLCKKIPLLFSIKSLYKSLFIKSFLQITVIRGILINFYSSYSIHSLQIILFKQNQFFQDLSCLYLIRIQKELKINLLFKNESCLSPSNPRNFPLLHFTNRDVKSDFQFLKHHFENLVPDEYLQKRLKMPSNKIMRKRRMMNYHIEFDKDGNMTRFHEEYRLDNYDETKCLQHANVYEVLTKEMKQDQIYKDFLYNTLQIIWQLKQFQKAQISVHAVRTISYIDQAASPTPEGPNRDGNDLEIIGVVNKVNCQGAESQIYSSNKSKLLFEMSLEPGEGYIQYMINPFGTMQHLTNQQINHNLGQGTFQVLF